MLCIKNVNYNYSFILLTSSFKNLLVNHFTNITPTMTSQIYVFLGCWYIWLQTPYNQTPTITAIDDAFYVSSAYIPHGA